MAHTGATPPPIRGGSLKTNVLFIYVLLAVCATCLIVLELDGALKLLSIATGALACFLFVKTVRSDNEGDAE